MHPFEQQWWADLNATSQARLRNLKWVREGIPKLRTLAAECDKETAFVLGPGPSADLVSTEQWKALSGVFSIGVNLFPYRMQHEHGLYDFPKVGFVTDKRKLSVHCDHIAEGLHNLKGIRMTSNSGFAFPSDFTAPVFCTPTWDMEYGLALTTSPRVRFNRSPVPCIHICALLGFRNIYLLGVDHRKDYPPADDIGDDEPARASQGFQLFQDEFLSQRGIKLWQCGEKSGFSSLPFKPLGDVLCQLKRSSNSETTCLKSADTPSPISVAPMTAFSSP